MDVQSTNFAHNQQQPTQHSATATNRTANEAFAADVELANTEYINYLKQMISSLIDNQMTLAAALDETREASSSTQEVQVLQEELSMCRQREAEVTLAYEDLRNRVEAIDQVIEQIPWLDVLFNSDEPLSARLKALKSEKPTLDDVSINNTTVCYDEEDEEEVRDEEEDESTPNHRSPEHHRQRHLHTWIGGQRNGQLDSKRTSCDSPLSDSGCTSESHDELSLASLNSTHSSPYLSQALTDANASHRTNLGRSLSVIGRFDRPQQQQQHPVVRMRNSACGKNPTQRPISTFGRLTNSLKTSISRFADKSEWKMEALVARQREARALVLLNETQAEIRKVESRCTGLTRRQNEQELRMSVKENEIQRLVNQERELRRELRNWQQRVFQLESETQEIKHNSQIAELEMRSHLLEASMLASDVAARCATQNPASLFNEDLLRFKSTEDATHSEESEDASRPPKFARPSARGRPRFSSASSLCRMPSASTGQQKAVSTISRPSSTLHLNQPTNAEQNCRKSLHATPFGSLSELKLRADV
ncbi:unnamed protein product [Mesocestoides corti]|uniref:Uncharacterized protein n=1 Tax=Mesocestoides corti TaxID=53468 RepID=A0A158QSV6_MESCO|nr:unnamed protein product [Mesocestoides corti]